MPICFCQNFGMLLKFNKWESAKKFLVSQNRLKLLMSAWSRLPCSLEVHAKSHKYQVKSFRIFQYLVLHTSFAWILQKSWCRKPIHNEVKIWWIADLKNKNVYIARTIPENKTFKSFVYLFHLLEFHGRLQKVEMHKLKNWKAWHVLWRSLKFEDITLFQTVEKKLCHCLFMPLGIWISMMLHWMSGRQMLF